MVLFAVFVVAVKALAEDVFDWWWAGGGERTWSWLHTVNRERGAFVEAGSVALQVLALLVLAVGMVRLFEIAARRAHALHTGPATTVDYDDREHVEAVARYHAALAAVIETLGGRVQEIGLGGTTIDGRLRAGYTAVSWDPDSDGDEFPADEREWTTLVATIAALHHYRANGDAAALMDTISDDDIAQLDTLARRVMLRAALHIPARFHEQDTVESVLARAHAEAKELLEEHRAEVDALVAATTTGFLRLIPRPLFEPRVQQCLSNPDNVLADPHDGRLPTPSATPVFATGVGVLVAGFAAFAAGTQLARPELMVIGLGTAAVGAAVFGGRLAGRPLCDRIAYELALHRHQSATKAPLSTAPAH
ncbi:hypothetical protein O4159_21570 [Gordonia terrae]|nr:hypothetical protein [Gordonia terrae]